MPLIQPNLKYNRRYLPGLRRTHQLELIASNVRLGNRGYIILVSATPGSVPNRFPLTLLEELINGYITAPVGITFDGFHPIIELEN